MFTGFIDDTFGSATAFNADGSSGPVSFVKWMSFAFPLSFFLLWVMWAIMWRVFGSRTLPTLPRDAVQRAYDNLGPMGFRESMCAKPHRPSFQTVHDGVC